MNVAPRAPLHLAIEGIDGAGKTEQTALLEKYFISQGKRVSVLSFPRYSSAFGKEIGGLLSGKSSVHAGNVDPKSMALWYAVDRMVAFRDAVANAEVVICNRFTLSNAVYQSVRLPVPERQEFAEWVIRLEHDELRIPSPDLYIFLDIDPELSRRTVSSGRIREHMGSEPDIYEQMHGMMLQAREQYLTAIEGMVNGFRVDCVDSQGNFRPMDTIHRDVIAVVRDFQRARGFY